MSRPKGSLNRSTIEKMQQATRKGGAVYNIALEKQVEGAPVTKDSSQGFVRFGVRNNYPQLLLDLYQNSPTHHAAINFEVQCIVGGGVDYQAMKLDGTQVFPNYQYSYDTLVRNIALDYCIYGSYAIEIIKNKDNKTYSFYHIPYEKLRCSPYDEDGVITSWWISNDWSALGQNPPIQIEAIDMRDDSKIKQGKPYIYVFKNYDPTVQYYQSPSYAAGISSVQSEIEYCKFELKTTTNSFMPSGMLVLNEVETDEERQAIIRNVTSMFTGAENAGACMITFRNNVEEAKPEYVPFEINKGNFNFYDSANQRIINRILAAHNIPSASLCGLPDVGNSGFASDSQKLETAYQLYQRLTGNFNRQNVIRTLNDMFKLNGIDVEIIMKELHFNDFGNETDTSTTTRSEDTTQDVSADNIEEQVTE